MSFVDLKGMAVMIQRKPEKCKGCPMIIHWALLPVGYNRWLPIHQDNNGNWIDHFKDCPNAEMFKKENRITINEDMV